MSQTKQHGNKSEFNEDQALKKIGNQQIKGAAFDLPSVVQRVSNKSARRSRDILTLQQTLGNRTVQRLLAEDSRLESEVAKGEAGTEIVQRQSFNQAGATVNGGDGTPPAGGGGTVNMLEVESHAAVQRQSYFDLYERSRKLDELKQRKKHLHTEREKVSKALEKAKKVLEGLQMEAGEKEKPTGVRIIETIGEFFDKWAGSNDPGGPGSDYRQKQRMKKEYAEQARKQEALIGKGKARFRELDDKIQAVNGEIAELTMAE